MIKALSKFLAVAATVIVLASCDPEYALRGGFEYQGGQSTDSAAVKKNAPQKRMSRMGTTESVRGTMRNIELLMFEGHEYIIVSYEGIAIIHSESCPCKRKKETIIE